MVPAAFVAATFLILGNALITSPISTGMNIGLTLLGIPVYFIWKRVAGNHAAAS